MITIFWYNHQNGISIKSNLGKEFYIGYSLSEAKKLYREKYAIKRAQWLQTGWAQMYLDK